MSSDQWRAIPGWEGYYEASTSGQVRSIPRTVTSTTGVTAKRVGRIIRSRASRTGYRLITLSRDGVAKTFTVHQLIALAFLGPRPERMAVCHNDGNRQNNAATNLRYDTYSANELDKVAHGTHSQSRKTHCPKGHAYDEANTIFTKGGRSRLCRTCNRASCAAAYQRRTLTQRSAS